MRDVKYLIIGAGISGLTFAEQKKNENFIVIEKDKVAGGLCQSFYDQGFVWDVAGHFFHFHSEKTREYYENLMKEKEQVTAYKCAKVYYGGKYIDAPFQYNIHQLPNDEFLECLTDLYYAENSNANISFDEYVRKKYGNGIASKFLIPYNEKLYACKMNELEKNSMGNFFPKLDFDMMMKFYRGAKEKTYNDTFRYPIRGCVEIINALLEKIDQNRVHLGEKVIKVDIKNKIVYTNVEKYKYEYLINTMSLNNFINIIGKDKNEKLNYNQVLVLNIGFDKPSLDNQVSWAYYPGNEIFYRVGFYNNITKNKRLSIYVEIGYRATDKIDIDYAMKRTLEDLRKVNIIDKHNMISYKAIIINPGYAHITTNGKIFSDKIMEEMKNKNIYMIGRYARWEYSAMDDSMEQAFKLAEII